MNNSLSSQINYLPISEAAKFLGVSQDTLRRWDKTGIIKSKRLDGKNRYFALTDLKKNVSNRTLSISEVSKKFNLSSTTLRRLESRGIIKPLRSKAGVRVFDSATIEAFIKSPYFQRKKYALKKPKALPKKAHILKQAPPPAGKEAAIKKDLYLNSDLDQTPKSTLGHFLAVSTAAFILLIVVGLGNVFLFKTQNYEMVPLSMVLGEKISAPARLPAPEIREIEETSAISEQEIQVEEPGSPLEKYIADSLNMINENKQNRKSYQSNFLRLVEVATDSANIHQNPDILSSIVGSAQNGEVFEFMSFDSGWIQLRLHESTQSGYLHEQFARVKEFEFSAPQSSGWSNLYEGTNSAQITDPTQATEEGKYDQSTN